MNDVVLVATIILADVLAAMTPGPDFVLTLRNSMQGGHRAGIATACGITVGISVHVAYCWLGLSLLLVKSPFIFALVKGFGACYLAWLGISCLRQTPANTDVINGGRVMQSASLSLKGAFANGFFTNLFNAKAIVFFISLYTVVLSDKTPAWIYITLALAFTLTTLCWFSLLALLVNIPKIRRILQTLEAPLMRCVGLLLLGFALRIGFDFIV